MSEASRNHTDREALDDAFVEDLREAFVALSRGEFATRLPRTFERDNRDTIAFLFNLMAEEIGDTFAERAAEHERTESLINSATEVLVQIGAGDFGSRVARTHDGSPQDVLAYLVNNAADELSAMFQQLEQKNAALEERANIQTINERNAYSTLAAGVGHELNTPLSYALGNLEYVQEEMLDLTDQASLGWLPEVIKALSDAQEGVRRAARIATDLKRLAPGRELDMQFENCDVQELVESSLSLVRNAVRHRTQLAYEFSPDVPAIRADEGRMGQVILNLVQNAMEAMPPDREPQHNRIQVVTRRFSERTVAIEVRDNGAGIPPEILPRIFDSFFTTRPVGEGTGLGLALCKRMVKDHGGRIEVESAVGQGSTFRLILPIANL